MRKVICCIFVLVIFCSCLLFSQEIYEDKVRFMMEALTNPSLAPETYVLGAGDRLQLHLWGNANAAYRLSVSQDGNIFIPKYESGVAQLPGAAYATVQMGDVVPSLGEIHAKGLTLDELQEEIQSRVKKYYRGVNARVSLIGLRLIPVSIHGSVVESGAYSITPLYRLSHLVELCGGISPVGSHRRISIEKTNGSCNTYDLYKFHYKGDFVENPYLEAGDIVIVPQAIMSVKVGGRLFRTGNFELKKGERLRDLIEMAGGYKKRGSLTRTIKIFNIKDPDNVVEVDPYKLLIENDSLSNVELKTGDVISVPMEPFTVTVVGQVTLGGTFEYEPGADFNYYLGLAGGYAERANEGDIRITRLDGTLLKWKQDVEIKPGDTVFIGRSEIKGWIEFLQVGLNAANLLFIIWTVSR